MEDLPTLVQELLDSWSWLAAAQTFGVPQAEARMCDGLPKMWPWTSTLARGLPTEVALQVEAHASVRDQAPYECAYVLIPLK